MSGKAIFVQSLDSLEGSRISLCEFDVIVICISTATFLERASGLAPGAKLISLSELVDQNKSFLHDEYLSWVGNSAFFSSKGYSNIKRFKVVKHESLWWSSLISEKCNFVKSPHIDLAIKLMALLHFVPSEAIGSILFPSGFPREVALCLFDICKRKGWNIAEKCQSRLVFRQAFARIPLENFAHFLLGTIWLCRQLFESLKCSRIKIRQKRLLASCAASRMFVTYSAQMFRSGFGSGYMNSNIYWSNLPGKLIENQINSIWLYVYSRDSVLTSLSRAAQYIDSLNSDAGGNSLQLHILPNVFFDLVSFFDAAKALFRLFINNFTIDSDLALPRYQGVRINLLHFNDYQKSLFGIVAAKNIYYGAIFRIILGAAAPISTIVYLQENMDWEYLLLSEAKNYRVGKVIGFPHTLVCYWDLRYSLPYISELCSASLSSAPLPDLIAVSGSLNRGRLAAKMPFLADRLVNVEALRYLYLADLSPSPLPTQSGVVSICILGTIVEQETKELLDFARKSLILSGLSSGQIKIFVRFHPMCDLSSVVHGLLGIPVFFDDRPIGQALAGVDAVLSGAMTCSSVDAAALGKKVFVFDSGNGLIVNPLLETDFATFVTSPAAFASELSSLVCNHSEAISQERLLLGGFLNLNSSLDGWLDLLR